MFLKNAIPLGFVELANGSKAIYPMNDLFLTYTFEDASNWESLRLAVNLVIDSYRGTKPDTSVKPIEGRISVRTQFRHLLSIDWKTTRDQDIKIIEDDEETSYVEFQNKATTNPPIEIRSVEYFGLGIGHGKGKTVNQLWLLAEDVEPVLHGGMFERYVLKSEVTGHTHPNTSGIMYVSLVKLSRAVGPVGELASFFLGQMYNPENGDVKKIAEAMKTSFEAFKADKEVIRVLTLAERYSQEGEAKGKEIGKEIGINLAADRIAELIDNGFSLDEALRNVRENKEWINGTQKK